MPSMIFSLHLVSSLLISPFSSSCELACCWPFSRRFTRLSRHLISAFCFSNSKRTADVDPNSSRRKERSSITSSCSAGVRLAPTALTSNM
ncbi:hypothetical protein PR003_g6458 [Phytophthora rubi]|uniref:Secreted protein n=1 Tax=Phytophthora rubi TaxID=129364 RepID=A0A6A3NN00_9STRA|nr:hypothetical protein PR002_g9604 [Phytophthora rubi]KAE9042576.1 hypothetical protein PR001_g6144 [Phytophthora rubi]KAE9348355.1 hypothetical protein PR003_g6458 [Phytophthora rubi]